MSNHNTSELFSREDLANVSDGGGFVDFKEFLQYTHNLLNT